MKQLVLAIYFLILLMPGFTSAAEHFSGVVVKVVDGDTCDVLRDDKTTTRVRFAEIDSPESGGQPYGQKAKEFTLGQAAQKRVTVEVRTIDRYGRTVGEIFLPDGTSLNRLLVQEGYAWWYRKYSKDETLGELESTARKEGRGLWRDKNPIAPWEWRRKK